MSKKTSFKKVEILINVQKRKVNWQYQREGHIPFSSLQIPAAVNWSMSQYQKTWQVYKSICLKVCIIQMVILKRRCCLIKQCAVENV